MASDFSNSGAFNVNGQWVTAVRYEATIAHGALKHVALRFFNGRSEVANSRVPANEARDLLGERNYAAIAEAAGAATRAGEPNLNGAIVKGELRGKSLEFRQVTLAGYETTHSENAIAFDSRAQRKATPSPDTDQHPPQRTVSDPHRLETVLATENMRHEAPHAADAPEAQPAANRIDPARERADETRHALPLAAAVPDSIAERFLKIDDKYYFPDKTLAFIDRGTKLKAETHNLEVIRCLVTIAQARNWQVISVTGTPEFRKEVWREASLRGLEVGGYEPTALDREELRRAIEKRHGPNDVNREASQHLPDRPARGGVDTQPVRATATRNDSSRRRPLEATDDVRTALQTGRLLEYGAAPYQFDPKQGLSYYVKLDTDRGERVVWGIDLERALVESNTRVQVGDVVALQNHGSKPVTIKVPRLDAAGNVVGEKEVQTHRNTWLIEKPSYFDERAEKVTAFRNGEADKRKLVDRYPDLTSAVVSLWLGEQFAATMIERPEDRERIVALVKETLAQALERGEAISTPMVKQEIARKMDGVDIDFDERIRRTRVRGSRPSTKPPRELVLEEPPHVRA